MAGILSTFSVPFFFLLSLPLAVFAILTTTFAFWILLFRASIVYAELFAALIQAYLTPTSLLQKDLSPASSTRADSPPSRRTSRSSSLESGVLMWTPTNRRTRSSLALASGLHNRDYEGVGGWRISVDDEEEAAWMGMNRGLELPAAPSRGHRGSWAGSRLPSGAASPELLRSPVAMRTPNRGMFNGSEMPSQDGYFSMPLTSMTNISRSSRVSFSQEDRPKSWQSYSSLTSLGSVKPTRQDTI